MDITSTLASMHTTVATLLVIRMASVRARAGRVADNATRPVIATVGRCTLPPRCTLSAFAEREPEAATQWSVDGSAIQYHKGMAVGAQVGHLTEILRSCDATAPTGRSPGKFCHNVVSMQDSTPKTKLRTFVDNVSARRAQPDTDYPSPPHGQSMR